MSKRFPLYVIYCAVTKLCLSCRSERRRRQRRLGSFTQLSSTPLWHRPASFATYSDYAALATSHLKGLKPYGLLYVSFLVYKWSSLSSRYDDRHDWLNKLNLSPKILSQIPRSCDKNLMIWKVFLKYTFSIAHASSCLRDIYRQVLNKRLSFF